MTSLDPRDLDLVTQMKMDAGSTAQDNMGKIGAVANDVADTDKEIADLEDQLKKKKDYKKHLAENVLPNLFAEVGLSELKLADGISSSVIVRANDLKKINNKQINLGWVIDHKDLMKILLDSINSNRYINKFKVLKWDRDEKRYYDIEIDLKG